ncbi:hypothetical protein GQ55_9G104700 [Panicum hallii var. hallii]|uniref:Uncharacterized protein n=1 Tax=Panicum hallii var. hallii TaxID=1504633 RepID=A0A2T7C1N7_9POAL|nr:hypothetical protein GQ55_9G104700 [Panicum hallii var. hallii]
MKSSGPPNDVPFRRFLRARCRMDATSLAKWRVATWSGLAVRRPPLGHSAYGDCACALAVRRLCARLPFAWTSTDANAMLTSAQTRTM